MTDPPVAAQPSLFDAAGGDGAFLALATAHHARCLADPELNHPFSHPGQHPEHVQRLAWYWAEVMGGPPRYTAAGGTHAGVVQMHSGNGDLSDLNRRFLACFLQAMDDAGLPTDPAFRDAMAGYMRWATRAVSGRDDEVDGEMDEPAEEPDGEVASDAPIPRWSWDGLQPPL